MDRKLSKILSICAVGLLVSQVSFGSTITASMPISATVNNSCSAVTASAIAFGNYNPLSSTPSDSDGTIAVTCTNNTPFNVSLNGGTTTGGTIAARKLAGPDGADLSYNLYTDSGHNTVWGDGTTGSVVSGTGTGSAVNETVYGAVPADQSGAVAGAYSDTVTVSVEY